MWASAHSQAAREGAVQAAESVMRFFETVEADAHIVKVHRRHALGHGGINQGSVGREAGIKTQGLGTLGDLEKIRA